MVHNTLFFLSVVIVTSLYSVSAASHDLDPSTVINVYPSLKKLKPKARRGYNRGYGGGGGGEDGRLGGFFADKSFKNCEEEAGCGAAASNLDPILKTKTDGEERDKIKSLKAHKMAKLAKLKAVKGNETSSKHSEEHLINDEDISNFDKRVDKSKVGLKKWISFPELLQILKKRKA